VTDPTDRLIRGLEQLGAEHEPPPGWEARVLRALAPRPRRTPWWLAIPVAALAAGVVVLLVLWRPRPEALVLAIERSPSASRTRGAVAGGGRIHAVVHGGERHRAIWVFRDGRELVAMCPGGAGCGRSGGAPSLDLALDRVGTYQVVALSAAEELPAPRGAYDADLAAAIAAGATCQTHDVEVQ
jgi:diadenosine tetraphosphatase ApaH/serine/threonine PP2A family protein phosphatase